MINNTEMKWYSFALTNGQTANIFAASKTEAAKQLREMMNS